jgi:hypothetical protein
MKKTTSKAVQALIELKKSKWRQEHPTAPDYLMPSFKYDVSTANGLTSNMAKPRSFETPEELLGAFEEYKQDLKKQESEWVKVYFVGKNSERIKELQKLPYIFEGFKRFCAKEYAPVCSQVKDEIREDQIIGGMLGFFNSSIPQQLNGLSDKREVGINSIKLELDCEEIEAIYV